MSFEHIYNAIELTCTLTVSQSNSTRDLYQTASTNHPKISMKIVAAVAAVAAVSAVSTLAVTIPYMSGLPVITVTTPFTGFPVVATTTTFIPSPTLNPPGTTCPVVRLPRASANVD